MQADRQEAEVASFLLQLKHRSPSPATVSVGSRSSSSSAYASARALVLSHACSSSSSSSAVSFGPHHTRLPGKVSYRSERSVDPSSRPPAATSFARGVSDEGVDPRHAHPHRPQSSSAHFSQTTLPQQGSLWATLLGNSRLVYLKDRDLVPDALFLAMAQMKPCRLSVVDRIGCYRNRPEGYLGLCCRHCGGQPGFGRFFPNSVRSLAQTTTSQTVLKHITHKCRECPRPIRDAVLDLQRSLEAEGNENAGRPRYGSRKIFFQRVWARLHEVAGGIPDAPNTPGTNDKDDEEEEEEYTESSSISAKLMLDDSASHETPSDFDEESLATYSNDTADNESGSGNFKRKSSFSAGAAGTGIVKRVKVTSPHHRLTAD